MTSLALGLTAAARSQQLPTAAPRFFLDAVTVENTSNVSAEIIVSESLLETGTSYTEDQLRDAVHRVVRLPFVLDADFSLRKGSQRDRYELVITVHEAETWFYGSDLEHRRLRVDSPLGDFSEALSTARLTAGKRWFVGRHGELFAAAGVDTNSRELSDEVSALTLGYNHYDLLGKGVVLSVGVGLQGFSSFGESKVGSVSLGIPLRTNQSFKLSSTYSWFDERLGSSPFVQSLRATNLGASLEWAFNSLDDPTLPTEGSLAGVSLQHFEARDRLRGLGFGEDGTPVPLDSDQRLTADRIDFSARRFWPVSRRQSVSAGATFGYLEYRRDGSSGTALDPPVASREDRWVAAADVGHQLSIIDRKTSDSWHQLRWETALSYRSEDLGTYDPSAFTGNGWSASTGLVWRTASGVYRLRFSYVDTQRRLEP